MIYISGVVMRFLWFISSVFLIGIIACVVLFILSCVYDSWRFSFAGFLVSSALIVVGSVLYRILDRWE